MSPIHEQFHSIEHFWIQPDWLGKRMLFISGPRQVGKTTLVISTLCTDKEAYFNWDDRGVRLTYQKNPHFLSNLKTNWVCFDEIHKRPKWKDILKGIYDVYRDRFHFVVTGSAKLETFRKSGDSLVGRYFSTHLFPLNLPDFSKTDFALPHSPKDLILQAADIHDIKDLEDLLSLGGFPEPFFSGSETFWKRWSANHQELILREDLRDLTKVVEVDKVETLLGMMKPSIGQTISYRNLAQDLESTHGSIRRWLEVMNSLQLLFPVSPYFRNIRRAYKTEKKWYFTDWRLAENNTFENYVAASLSRAVTLWTDRFGEKMTLHFVRTHDQAEVDFLVCKNSHPWLLVEAKEGTPDVTSAVRRFSRELNVPCIIVTRKKGFFRKAEDDIYCLSWSKFGPLLP